jgi:4'-phosphopantetheinyl transferase
VHVWHISLADTAPAKALKSVLSADERSRADRFAREDLHDRFVISHAWVRKILASYVGLAPTVLQFVTGEHGKPRLSELESGPPLEFNLSHSGARAVLAVSHGQSVGIDIERRARKLEYLGLAERSFSAVEYHELASLAHDPELLAKGFFACWTRKEAYLKATGHGISRGLGHFDVTLAPGVPARLLADRLDPGATSRWELTEITVSPEYSVALAVEAPLQQVILHEAGD